MPIIAQSLPHFIAGANHSDPHLDGYSIMYRLLFLYHSYDNFMELLPGNLSCSTWEVYSANECCKHPSGGRLHT